MTLKHVAFILLVMRDTLSRINFKRACAKGRKEKNIDVKEQPASTCFLSGLDPGALRHIEMKALGSNQAG